MENCNHDYNGQYKNLKNWKKNFLMLKVNVSFTYIIFTYNLVIPKAQLLMTQVVAVISSYKILTLVSQRWYPHPGSKRI